MNRAEIIEGLNDIRDRFYGFKRYRETIESCLKLLENENALIDRVLEIISQERDKKVISWTGLFFFGNLM